LFDGLRADRTTAAHGWGPFALLWPLYFQLIFVASNHDLWPFRNDTGDISVAWGHWPFRYDRYLLCCVVRVS
jgi:hypothetical protein